MEHEAGEYKVVQHVFGTREEGTGVTCDPTYGSLATLPPTRAVESCEIMIHPLHLGDLWLLSGCEKQMQPMKTTSGETSPLPSGGFNKILSSISSI